MGVRYSRNISNHSPLAGLNFTLKVGRYVRIFFHSPGLSG